METTGFRVVYSDEKRISSQRVPFLLTLLTIGGILFCLQGLLYRDMSYIPMIVIIIFSSGIACFLGRSKRDFLLGTCLLAVLFIITQVLFSSHLTAGAADFLNQIIAQYNYISGKSIDYFVVPECGNMIIAYWCFEGWLAVISACYLYQLIKRKHPILLFFCWLPILAGGLYLQFSLGGLVTAWAVVSVLGTFAYSQMKVSKDSVYAATILVLLVMLCGVGSLYFHLVAYHPSKQLEDMKEYVTKQVEYSRFGTPDYPEGDLKEELHSSLDLRLKVELSGEARVYLKGYTGSVFKDTSWEMLEPTSYGKKYEGMIHEYSQRQFHPLAQQSCYIDVAEQVEGAKVTGEKITVTIENIGASRKYTYIPYGLSFDSLTPLMGVYQDVNVLSLGKDSEKISYDVNITKQDALISYHGMDWLNAEYDVNEETANYRMSEADYRKFVYEYYLDLDRDTEKQWKNKLPEGFKSLTDLTKGIRELLVKWGEKERNWTPANYSTVGTLLYRNYGIPARYVEGYLAEGSGEVEVTAQDAHAWVEIYKDGIGWLPVDVTPGFYGEILAPEELKEQQNTVNHGQSIEENVKEKEKQKESAAHNVAWILNLFLGIGILTGIILLVFFGFWLYHKILWKRRQQEMADKEPVKQLQYLSSYLFDLAAYMSLKEEELSQEVKNVLSVLWYSTNPSKVLKTEDVRLVKEETAFLQKSIWDKAGRRQRWLLRYWHHLEFPVLEEDKE